MSSTTFNPPLILQQSPQDKILFFMIYCSFLNLAQNSTWQVKLISILQLISRSLSALGSSHVLFPPPGIFSSLSTPTYPFFLNLEVTSSKKYSLNHGIGQVLLLNASKAPCVCWCSITFLYSTALSQTQIVTNVYRVESYGSCNEYIPLSLPLAPQR